jgi:hypothetical protein
MSSKKVNEYITCKCNGKTFKTGSSYNVHQKSMIHRFYETKKELKYVRSILTEKDNKIQFQANHIETLNKDIENLTKKLEINILAEEKVYEMTQGKYGKKPRRKKRVVKRNKKVDID